MKTNNKQDAMTGRCSKTFAMAALLAAGALGQSDYFLRGTAPIFTADTLYVGAQFARTNSTSTVNVWLKGNSAAWQGELYLIHPVSGAEIFLFKNYGNLGPTNIDITSHVAAAPLNTPITFRYKVNGGDPWWWFYTGPNLPGISTYVNGATSDIHPNPDRRYGRRFSVVGKSKTAGVLDGSLELGFEDNSDMGDKGWVLSDMDYNDIIFGVSGMSMGVTTRTLASKGFVW
jgi:hypothetical protein